MAGEKSAFLFLLCYPLYIACFLLLRVAVWVPRLCPHLPPGYLSICPSLSICPFPLRSLSQRSSARPRQQTGRLNRGPLIRGAVTPVLGEPRPGLEPRKRHREAGRRNTPFLRGVWERRWAPSVDGEQSLKDGKCPEGSWTGSCPTHQCVTG